MTITQELYALGDDRTARFARGFLERFLPERESLQAEFPVPENEDEPRVTFQAEDEILAYLEATPGEPYGLYWGDRNPASSRQAMLFYTRDGKVIFGLAEAAEDAAERLRELSRFVGAQYALMGSEERPPETARESVERCRRSRS
jgi:hypothetical protein